MGINAMAASMVVELLLPSLLAGLLVALSSGMLGCFVVWRRMAFFSDALAHSAIMGTALALLANVDILYGLLGYGLLVAFILARFDKQLENSSDTLLAIIAQTSLAGGILLIPFTGKSIALESLLFGDILAVTWQDVYVIAAVCVLIVTSLLVWHKPLIDIAIDERLAASEGVPVKRFKLLLFCLMAGLIAVAIQMVGVLLVGALLLMPAMIARRFAQTPLSMMLLAPFAGMLAIGAGLALAWFSDAAAGPAIVVSAAAIWLLSLAKPIR